MARTQKNKATNYHLGTLKAKLAKLRSELLIEQGGGGGGGRELSAVPCQKYINLSCQCLTTLP
jgi:ribosome-interacting GTPase 1